MRTRNIPILLIMVFGLLFCCLPGGVWAAENAAPAAAVSETPFHTVLKDYTVREIYDAASHVIFTQLGLSKKKSEDCNCTTNKADLLSGRIEALSADGITFVFRAHYFDEATCGVWIHATQESDVPGDLKKYSQLIYDRTIGRLEEMQQTNGQSSGSDGGAMEFSAEYTMTVEQMYRVINDTANQVRIGHNTTTRNRFLLEGNFISGHTQFSYKAYMVADDKLKFSFRRNGRISNDGVDYIYQTICKEFRRQLKQHQPK